MLGYCLNERAITLEGLCFYFDDTLIGREAITRVSGLVMGRIRSHRLPNLTIADISQLNLEEWQFLVADSYKVNKSSVNFFHLLLTCDPLSVLNRLQEFSELLLQNGLNSEFTYLFGLKNALRCIVEIKRTVNID